MRDKTDIFEDYIKLSKKYFPKLWEEDLINKKSYTDKTNSKKNFKKVQNLSSIQSKNEESLIIIEDDDDELDLDYSKS